MNEQINIQAAYIHGHVGFAGLDRDVTPPHVEIVATQDRDMVNTSVPGIPGEASRYCLVVKPGPWNITAKCGPLESKPKQINLNPGQSLEVDFVFGS